MVRALEGLVAVVPVVLLVSIRMGAALAILPAPLGSGAPMVVRAVAGVMLAIAVTLPVRADLPAIPLDALALGFAALGELTIGAAIGLVARGAIASAEVAGEIAGGAMGLGFASSVDPSSGEQTLLPARVLGMMAMLLFLAAGGHHALIAGVAASLRVAPPGAVWAAASPEALLAIGRVVLADGLRVASPIVATMLVAQVGVGIVARATPRLQVFTLSFATAASVGLLVLAWSAPSMFEAIAIGVDAVPERLGTLFGP